MGLQHHHREIHLLFIVHTLQSRFQCCTKLCTAIERKQILPDRLLLCTVQNILYAKELHAGEQIRLGVNGQSSGCVNYTIFATEAEPEKIEGDVNADGQLSVSDAIMLQKWLLCVPDASLTDWQAADLCEDGRIDAFDLCLLKRKLLTKNNR